MVTCSASDKGSLGGHRSGFYILNPSRPVISVLVPQLRAEITFAQTVARAFSTRRENHPWPSRPTYSTAALFTRRRGAFVKYPRSA
jgi:hypothetical protein